MSAPITNSNLHEAVPASQEELGEVVARAYAEGTPLYPVGGGTSLTYGLPAKRPGTQLSLAKLDRVIDYPARDLTITVEAGITMQALSRLLANEEQELPIDVPCSDRATVGGVVATNWNGPRRLGCGGIRDYVIGITAVDGRGVRFSGGGRVVKNVAGYDFCKLLTGSMGSLAVITELTFKLRPKCASRAFLWITFDYLEQVEVALQTAASSAALPAAVSLVVEPGTGATSPLGLFLLLEGAAPEVEWMTQQLVEEFCVAHLPSISRLASGTERWSQLVEFPAHEAPLTLKASMAPSGVLPFVAAVRKIDSGASILAQVASGIVLAHFSALPPEGASKVTLNLLQPLAAKYHGHVHVLAAAPGTELTRQSLWGSLDALGPVMLAVKQKFDPENILNPGRFLFA